MAISFPRYGADIGEAARCCGAAGSQAWIIAKIKRAEAVADDDALDALIRASDGVMVARGDLGVEGRRRTESASRSASSSTRVR